MLSAFSTDKTNCAKVKNCIRICAITFESMHRIMMFVWLVGWLVGEEVCVFSVLPICYNFHKCVSGIYLLPSSVVTPTIVILINGNVADPVFSVRISVG